MGSSGDNMSRMLTVGEVAARFQLPAWKVRRLFERGLLPSPARVARYRVIAESDLGHVEAALLAAGYLGAAKDAPPVCATAVSRRRSETELWPGMRDSNLNEQRKAAR